MHGVAVVALLDNPTREIAVVGSVAVRAPANVTPAMSAVEIAANEWAVADAEASVGVAGAKRSWGFAGVRDSASFAASWTLKVKTVAMDKPGRRQQFVR